MASHRDRHEIARDEAHFLDFVHVLSSRLIGGEKVRGESWKGAVTPRESRR
jgi:hypothetical protein